MAEADEKGQITKAYGFNPTTMQLGLWSTDPVWQAETPGGSLTDPKARYDWLHTDHLGTPILATTKEGQTSWKAIAESFGATQIIEQDIEVNLRFPGQYFDEETGTHYNFHRDYRPNAGRYLQGDPIGLKGGVNLYMYGDASPLIYVDPIGLDVWFGGEMGITAHALLGASYSFGALLNVNTGEACPYVQTCFRIGPGLQLTAGLKGVTVLCGGPHCGKNLSGFSWSLSGEITFLGVGISGSISRADGKGVCGAGSGVGYDGKSVGLGASIAIERCYMHVASYACKNTPCECKDLKSCDCPR